MDRFEACDRGDRVWAGWPTTPTPALGLLGESVREPGNPGIPEP
jgi:hypothetical protein